MEMIQKGSKGTSVVMLQKMLNIYADGIFGALTEEAVKEFQRENMLVADGIVGRKTWEALERMDNAKKQDAKPPKGITLEKSRRAITEIIVHCTATPEGTPFTCADIKRWHLQRGFSDIGYHYVVYLDGSVRAGRSVHTAGAHCTGHNTKSIGVCYIGGVAKDGKTAKDTRNTRQVAALRALLTTLKKLYPKATIHGHREFANKACPSFDARAEYRLL